MPFQVKSLGIPPSLAGVVDTATPVLKQQRRGQFQRDAPVSNYGIRESGAGLAGAEFAEERSPHRCGSERPSRSRTTRRQRKPQRCNSAASHDRRRKAIPPLLP